MSICRPRAGSSSRTAGSRQIPDWFVVPPWHIECMFEALLEIDPDANEATLVAQIGDLETLKSVAAAGQVRATAALAAKRRAAETARGVPAAKRGRGLAGEVALARRDAPARGGRHLGFAMALVHEMPHTLAALASGVLSEWRATLIVRESACLDVDDRARLDAELCADVGQLDGKGDARIAADAKAIAYRLDPHAVVDRAARAETERGVTVRPAPDCMTYLTALLPMTQGVSVYAALKRQADACGDGRSRGQIMADTLVERVTGRPATVPTPIAVNLVISDDTLIGEVPTRPVSPTTARYPPRWPASSPVRRDRRPTPRPPCARLYKHPRSGALVAMESRSRLFPTGLARSSPCATTPAGHRIATHRSATPTTPPPFPRRTDLGHQRAGYLRSLQLHQRGRRLAGHRDHPRNRRPHHRTPHPHRGEIPINRPTTTRTHHHQPPRNQHRHRHRPTRRLSRFGITRKARVGSQAAWRTAVRGLPSSTDRRALTHCTRCLNAGSGWSHRYLKLEQSNKGGTNATGAVPPRTRANK